MVEESLNGGVNLEMGVCRPTLVCAKVSISIFEIHQ